VDGGEWIHADRFKEKKFSESALCLRKGNGIRK